MAGVFISYSSKNNELAAELRDWLKVDGHDVFLDYDRHDGIEGGVQWRERLYERLRWADVVLCIVTGDYEISRWCFGEIVAAKTCGSRILPLVAEEGAHHPLLDDLQYIIYHGARLQSRERISRILREIDAAGGAGWPDGRSPFPGLRAFDVDMHRAFFGRRREVDDLVRQLRSLAERGEGQIVVIVGPSGCGKSSLVRAGLLPAMANEPGWATLAPFIPGTDPVAALSQALAHAARSTPSRIRQQLDEDKGLVLAVEDLLSAGASPLRRRLLIVIDQCEEILTRSSATGRAQLAEMLRPAVAGPVQVVMTIRSEFLDSWLVDPHLAQLPLHSVPLRPLDTAILPLVIEGPARLAGLGVDPELVSRMVADTASGDALPLLAFTLEQLALDLPRGTTLSPQRYHQLGGVKGALIRQADLALVNAMAADQRAGNGRSRTDVLDSLLRLVTVDETGQPTRRDVDYQQLPRPVQVELGAFVAHRLLTSSQREEAVLVGVAHEAFLTAWRPLAQAISAAGAALRMRRTLEQASTEWEDAHRSTSFLWEQDRLAAAVSETGAQLHRVHPNRPEAKNTITGRFRALRRHREVTSGQVELSPTMRAFLHASIRHQQRRRRLFFTVVTAALVLAFTITTITVIQRQIAENQTELATVRGLVVQAEARRGNDPRLALKLGIAAHRIRPTVETGTSLSTTLTSTPLTATLTGHTGPVVAVTFSPDGHTLATASDDTTVGLWDITDRTNPTRTATLSHTDAVYGVAFSPDGHTLATASDDTTVGLWDITDRTHPTRTTTLTGRVHAVAFSPDGHTLATASADHTAGLWDITDRTHPTRTATLTGHTGPVVAVMFSPDGHTLATASYDTTVGLWDTTDRTNPTRTATLSHTSLVYGVAFSPDGHTLATSSYDHTVGLWDVSDRTHPARTVTLTGHSGLVYGVAFSPDGHTLATASADTTVGLWDVSDRTHPARTVTLTGHSGWVHAVAFSPDGHTLATGGDDTTVGLWDVSDRTHPARTATLSHANAVSGVAFSPDGHTLATSSADTTVGLWDITDRTDPTRTATLTGHSGLVYGVAFSPDGHTLATASYDTTVGLWDVSDRTHPTRTATLSHTSLVYGVAFSPDGHTLATSSADNTVGLWDITDHAHPTRTAALSHTDAGSGVAFSPDGHTLATGSDDHTVGLWDISDPTHPARTATLTGHSGLMYGVAFSPDGHTLATASADTTAGLWDVSDRTHLTRTATLSHTGLVYGVAFSPDGHTLATSSADNTVGLWDITDRTHPARTATLNHTDTVSGVAFSPDGHTLATASDDHTAGLWDLRGILGLSGHLISRSCAAAGGGLTPEQWDTFAPGIPYRPTC
jgi:WD40 repeat protein/energy-coupling factor transporter ATP-binding protein EcfA2